MVSFDGVTFAIPGSGRKLDIAKYLDLNMTALPSLLPSLFASSEHKATDGLHKKIRRYIDDLASMVLKRVVCFCTWPPGGITGCKTKK